MQVISQAQQINSLLVSSSIDSVPSDRMPVEMWQQLYLSCLQFDNCVVALDTALALSATNKCIRPLFDDAICRAFLERYFLGPYLRESIPQGIPSLQSWRFTLLKNFTYTTPRIPQNQLEGKFALQVSEWCPNGLARVLHGNDYFVVSDKRAVLWYGYKEQKLLYIIDPGQTDHVRSIHPDWKGSLFLIDRWLVLIEQWDEESTAHTWDLESIRQKTDNNKAYGCFKNCWTIQGSNSLVYVLMSGIYDPETEEKFDSEIRGYNLLDGTPTGYGLSSSEGFYPEGFCEHEGLLHCIDTLGIQAWQQGEKKLIQMERPHIDLKEEEFMYELKVCGNRVLAFSQCNSTAPVHSLGLMWYYSLTEHKWHRTAHRVRADRIISCVQIEDQEWCYVYGGCSSIFCVALDESPSTLPSEDSEFLLSQPDVSFFQAEAFQVIYGYSGIHSWSGHCTHDYRGLPRPNYEKNVLNTSIQTLKDIRNHVQSGDRDKGEALITALLPTLQEHLHWFSLDPFSEQAIQQVLTEALTELLLHTLQTTTEETQGILQELKALNSTFTENLTALLDAEILPAGKIHVIKDTLANLKRSWCLACLGIITDQDRENMLTFGDVALLPYASGLHSIEDVQLLGVDTTQEPLIDHRTSGTVLCERLERLLATMRSWQKSCLFRFVSELESWPFLFDTQRLEDLQQQIEAHLQAFKVNNERPKSLDAIHGLIQRSGGQRALLEQISGQIEYALRSKIDAVNALIKQYNSFKQQHEILKVVAYLSAKNLSKGSDLMGYDALERLWVFMCREKGIQTLRELQAKEPHVFAKIVPKYD